MKARPGNFELDCKVQVMKDTVRSLRSRGPGVRSMIYWNILAEPHASAPVSIVPNLRRAVLMREHVLHWDLRRE